MVKKAYTEIYQTMEELKKKGLKITLKKTFKEFYLLILET